MSHRMTHSMSQWAEWGSDGELVLIPPRADRCYVYVAWGEDRARPLYVGKARNPWTRMAQHMSIPAPWTAEMVELECHAFPTERMAQAAEIEAIQALDPIYNRMRRLTPAQAAEARRAAEAQRAEFWAAFEANRQKRLERERATRRKARVAKRPAPLPEPRRPRKVRVQRWREELFTPDQMAIIARVQNRGRTA